MEKVAIEKIDFSSEKLNTLSQEIWKNPELGFKEHHAHDVLTTFLEQEGFQVERQYILETAFRASFGTDDGPQIAVMAEYDALPDIGHACGHNLIAEAAIGAALGVKAALEQMDMPRGRVIVLGTPAEEGGAGKVAMLKGGALVGLDTAMMVHPCMIKSTRPSCNTRIQVSYHFHGEAAHAAMSPWLGKNALDAAVQCYTGISAQRQQFHPDVRVHGVFTNGGSRPNVIPEDAELLYYLRAPTTEQLKPVIKKCENCAKGAAIAADCTVKVSYLGYYAEVLSNVHLADMFKENCERLGMEFSKDEKVVGRMGGSTDMGNVSFVVPSIHPMYALDTDAPNHSREFTAAAGAPAAQEPTLIQAKAMALTILQLLLPGGDAHLKKIKAEFSEVPPNPYATCEKSLEGAE